VAKQQRARMKKKKNITSKIISRGRGRYAKILGAGRGKEHEAEKGHGIWKVLSPQGAGKVLWGVGGKNKREGGGWVKGGGEGDFPTQGEKLDMRRGKSCRMEKIGWSKLYSTRKHKMFPAAKSR